MRSYLFRFANPCKINATPIAQARSLIEKLFSFISLVNSQKLLLRTSTLFSEANEDIGGNCSKSQVLVGIIDIVNIKQKNPIRINITPTILFNSISNQRIQTL